MAVPLPFDGLKVLDISWVAVGPTTVKYLADHGATAVRVEAATPLDILRTAGPFKDGVPGRDRSQFFGEFNTSKLGLCLDLKMGTVPYAGHQFRIKGYDSGPRIPAPVLGQHTEQVLREVLGMTDDEAAEAVIAEAIM